jgi:hypothetical protein
MDSQHNYRIFSFLLLYWSVLEVKTSNLGMTFLTKKNHFKQPVTKRSVRSSLLKSVDDPKPTDNSKPADDPKTAKDPKQTDDSNNLVPLEAQTKEHRKRATAGRPYS